MGKAIAMSNDHGEFDKACTESKATGTVGNFPHGSRESPVTTGHRAGRRTGDRS
jgi:hypothetical protein